ncbi:MAG: hypothetical protein ACI8S6_002419 [Myxococcota bacterium]|jgi:hypothetical protein
MLDRLTVSRQGRTADSTGASSDSALAEVMAARAIHPTARRRKMLKSLDVVGVSSCVMVIERAMIQLQDQRTVCSERTADPPNRGSVG